MQSQQDFYNAYRLFKIPALQLQKGQFDKSKVVIGLIDASGSMGSFWKDMAKFWNQSIAEQANFLITFSQTARLEEHPYLDEDIKKYGGGMTNILDAFRVLEERLTYIDKDASITIVFISDGEDTVNGEQKLKKGIQQLKGGQGRDITFLCLGIKSGFPTFISIELRKLYHTGDEKIPAVYLIQYASDKAFFNKFQTMSNCFKCKNKIAAPDAGDYCKQYPWQKPGSLVFEEQKWILVHKEFKVMKIVYDDKITLEYDVPDLKAVPLDELVDCFRGWVQKVQIISMDKNKLKQAQECAELAAKTMRQFTQEYELLFDLYIIRQKPQGKQSFKTRAMGLAVKNIGSRIQWFLDQLDIIAKGSGIAQLNQYEAAKRIAIGTITGKYHQKALALKGITIKDFMEIKEQFAKVFKQIKLSEKPSSQEPSIFTLQNQKQVFQQPDFLQGLNYCKTQFDLVQSFPVVGYGLKVKRYDGSMINPWKVRMQSIAIHHKTIDSMYLAKNDNICKLSVGNDETQTINAVLPLFELEDAEMTALFNTRLFRLAVSFMVVQNIDTYHEEAYLALLGAVFVFMLKQPDNQWKESILGKIYTSIKVTYGATEEFQNFIKEVEADPWNLFKAKSKEDHVDITKVLLIIFYIGREKSLGKQKMQHLADLALVHYAEKTYVENEFKIHKVADIKLSQIDEKEGKVEGDLGNLNVILSDNELKTIVEKEVGKFIAQSCINVELNDKIFRHQDEQKRVTYPHINNFFKMFHDRPLNPMQIMCHFGHYLLGKSQQNYNKPVVREVKAVEKLCGAQINPKDLSVGQGKKMKKIKKMVEYKYIDHFRATHFGILPFTKQKLQKLCLQLNLNIKDYDFNESTGLIRNACMSSNCLYHMKKLTKAQMRDHLRLWHGQVPARFHMTVVNMLKQKKDPKEISELVIKSGLVNLKKHKKNQEFVLNYIVAIRDTLKQ